MKIIAIGTSIIIMLILFFYADDREGRYYDCSISEISPDYPAEVKDACRRLRIEEQKIPKNYI